MRVVYIGGSGRSGSTLLERILGELPAGCALGELMQLWARLRRDDRCSCGAPLSACGFWRAVGDKAFGGWHRLDLDRVVTLRQRLERWRQLPALAAPRLTGRRRALVEEYADYYHRIYEAAGAVSGARFIVDASKRPTLAYLLHRAGLDIRVVQLLRDPRGVAYSWTKQVAQPPGDGAAMMPRYRPAASALFWNLHHAVLKLLPVHRLRYEDLLADPRQAVTSLADHTGVPVEPADLSFVDSESVLLGPSHTVAGNPLRFHTGRLTLRPDDAWRSALPAADRRVVTAVCAPLLAAYGYPLRLGG